MEPHKTIDNKVVAFTGHRPNKLGGYRIPNPTFTAVTEQIRSALEDLKPTQAISGMALGVDQWAAQICIELDIPFIAAVPFEGQEKVWPEASKKTYQELLDKAERIVVVTPGKYDAWKMQKRNEWMVDHCDVLIAVWNGDLLGGTSNCVAYAKSVGKEIIRITPEASTD
jgi:uncharacterized phage-like protein YoqJ